MTLPANGLTEPLSDLEIDDIKEALGTHPENGPAWPDILMERALATIQAENEKVALLNERVSFLEGELSEFEGADQERINLGARAEAAEKKLSDYAKIIDSRNERIIRADKMIDELKAKVVELERLSAPSS